LGWDENKNIPWKVELPGSAWSSPVISGNQIWLTSAETEPTVLLALCVDRSSGALRPKHRHRRSSRDRAGAPEELPRFARADSFGGPRVRAPWSVCDGMSGNHRTSAGVATRLSTGCHRSSILVGDKLYFVSDNRVASRVNALSGELHWRERLDGNYSASPVIGDDRLYFLNETRTTYVVRPGPKFEQLATYTVPRQTLASLAVAGRALYVRTDTHLYRIEARE